MKVLIMMFDQISSATSNNLLLDIGLEDHHAASQGCLVCKRDSEEKDTYPRKNNKIETFLCLKSIKNSLIHTLKYYRNSLNPKKAVERFKEDKLLNCKQL